MKVRTTIAGTALSARLTAVCWGALTLLAPAAVSACTSSSSPSTPVFSPSVTGPAPATASPGSTASAGSSASAGSTASHGTPGVSESPSASHPATATPTATVTETVTAEPSSSTSQIPTAAPVAGGGGTAGSQDALLFGLGAAAILAGAGGIAYRKKVTRDR